MEQEFEASPHRAELERMFAGRLPDGWDADVPKKGPDAGMIATRKASNEVIQWAASKVPELVGGSADLAPSTLTLINGGGSVEARQLRRAATCTSASASTAWARSSTASRSRASAPTAPRFLIFNDYMKAAVRLAALMRIPSIFVYTHDSIGLGEDGPTHQPIEQLATLRATPNVDVVRPAGFNETALAWRHALRQTDRPTAFALSRQGLPVWDPSGRAGRRDRARRLRPARQRGRRSGADPHGHRLGGPPGARGDEAAGGGRRSACGS